MLSSQQFLTGKGPLGAIWVAAYFFKKLKRSQVNRTDVSTTVDKILETEFGEVAYRVMACLLLGVVRIYSKKVEYLFADCNKVLLMVKDFAVTRKDDILIEKMCAPYFAITLPETFELDAFDLGIADETTHRENVTSLEEITLKDGIWKTGEKRQSFSKGPIHELLPCPAYDGSQKCYLTHCQNKYDVAANSWDPCPGSPTFGGDDHEFSLMDFDEEMGTFFNAKSELPGSSYSRREGSVLLKFSRDEEVPSALFEKSSQDFQTNGKNATIPQTANLVQVHEDDRVSKKASINANKSTVVEGTPANDVQSYCDIHGIEPEIIKDPNPTLVRPEIEMHQVSLEACHEDDLKRKRQVSEEECNQNDFLTSTKKPRDDGFVLTMGIEMPEELPQRRSFDEGRQNDIEHLQSSQTILSGRGNRQAVAKKHATSVQLDVNMECKNPEASGATTPDFLATPAAKERARLSRKRKCVCDDLMILPNRILKQQIEDASDLVYKRKKFPRTSLGIWRFYRISKLSQSFFEPLIPYGSPELRSLFYMEKLKIPNSVETLNQAEVCAPVSPTAYGYSAVDKSAEEHVVLSNVSETSRSAKSVEMVEPSDKEEITLESGRWVEKPAEMLDHGESTQVGVQVEPKESPRKEEMHRSVEAEESRERLSASRSPGVGRSAGERAAMSNAPESSHAAISGEMVEPAENGETAGARDGRGRLQEEQLIAPETPVRQMTSLRSFDSPERPEMSDDSLTPEFHVKREPSRKVEDTDLNFMNEEINSQEVDNQTGWSERTRAVMRHLNTSFLNQGRRNGQETVRLLPLLEGKTRKESARMFYEILVLGTKGCVRVRQEEAYGNILVRKSARWDQALGSDGF